MKREYIYYNMRNEESNKVNYCKLLTNKKKR